MKRSRHDGLLIVLLAVIIFVSAFSVVIVKNLNRKAFAESEFLQRERHVLESEWSRLQTENSTLRMPGYIEKSVEELRMVYPSRQIPIIVP